VAPIEVEAAVTEEMYLRWYRWNIRKRPGPYIGAYFGLALFAALMALILIWEARDINGHPGDEIYTALLGLLLGIMIGFFVALCTLFVPLPRIMLMMARGSLNQAKTYSFYPDHMDILAVEPGGCTILRFHYTAVTGVHKAQDAYYFLLDGHRQYKAIIIPKKALSPEQKYQVAQWINAARGV